MLHSLLNSHYDGFVRGVTASLAALAVAAVVIIARNFNTRDPWFYVGLTLAIVTTVATNGVMRELRTRTLNEEFEAGYRVGYRAGRRCSLTVARPSGLGTDPIPLRRTRRSSQKDPQGQNEWQDSENFRQGSTRRQ